MLRWTIVRKDKNGGNVHWVSYPIEMLDDIVVALETILRDRPDINNFIEEPVETYHVATPEEIKAQVEKGELGETVE